MVDNVLSNNKNKISFATLYFLFHGNHGNLRSLIYPIKIKGISSELWLCHYYYMDAYKTHREKATWKLHENAMSYFETITPQKNSCMATYLPSQKPFK